MRFTHSNLVPPDSDADPAHTPALRLLAPRLIEDAHVISDSARYALKALAELALLPGEEYLGAASLAGRVDVPANYLGKLLQLLSREGLLESQKGAGGGFRLARPAEQIALIEVLEPIDRVSRWQGCVLGNAKCPGAPPCSLHAGWGKVRDSYIAFLEHTMISELADASARHID